MENKVGKFRFAYFTDRYKETFEFYQNKLSLELEHSWDRSKQDKGALFKAGKGLIEILHRPDKEHQNDGLDYHIPQGVFAVIQVGNVDELCEKYQEEEISIKQALTDQPWGHRSFSIVEPNGLVLFFFQEMF